MKKMFSAALLAALSIIMIILSGCSDGVPENAVFTSHDAQASVMGAVEDTAAAVYAAKLGTVKVFDTDELLMTALRTGVVDCAVVESRSSAAAMKGQRGVKKLDEPLFDVGFCFAVAKENVDLTEDINAVLAVLREDGTLDRIAEGYFDGTYEQPVSEGEKPKTVITLAVGYDLPPYKFTDDRGKPDGIDVAAAKAVCAELGLGLEIIEVPGTELISVVMSGGAHFAAGGITGLGESTDYVDVTDAYAECSVDIIVRK